MQLFSSTNIIIQIVGSLCTSPAAIYSPKSVVANPAATEEVEKIIAAIMSPSDFLLNEIETHEQLRDIRLGKLLITYSGCVSSLRRRTQTIKDWF